MYSGRNTINYIYVVPPKIGLYHPDFILGGTTPYPALKIMLDTGPQQGHTSYHPKWSSRIALNKGIHRVILKGQVE